MCLTYLRRFWYVKAISDGDTNGIAGMLWLLGLMVVKSNHADELYNFVIFMFELFHFFLCVETIGLFVVHPRIN